MSKQWMRLPSSAKGGGKERRLNPMVWPVPSFPGSCSGRRSVSMSVSLALLTTRLLLPCLACLSAHPTRQPTKPTSPSIQTRAFPPPIRRGHRGHAAPCRVYAQCQPFIFTYSRMKLLPNPARSRAN
ncbi:hypothetical protein B0T17DRAFT_611145 [Bombardia bombarda]|uniref:Uncharacterized protein n=1 Tax=Bombardia bombarda TaxID=252184 RepID=A0AA39U2G2_9PEZI|nr:hypothetical protein B0T17DRAFT_611145 [Bombardia bombarda]